MSDDERAIRDVVDRWMAASRAGDTPAVLDLMTDDVIFMTPGREPFGKEQFAAQSASLKGMEIDGRADTVEIEVLGDRAWIRNRLDMTMTPAGGEPVHRASYTLTILKRCDDGRWRLFRDANLVT
ncbi:YybH family protein [Sphingomonas sp. URHD0057]|uniref:YybH family protein n=1 Tax=Sphingomonas sp. URHD0057 TaxID=1380389 RepID=UPI00048B9410|nr:SgcJ/EcaC family oxidoreductase [Sphingomonas sp. URHD0057]